MFHVEYFLRLEVDIQARISLDDMVNRVDIQAGLLDHVIRWTDDLQQLLVARFAVTLVLVCAVSGGHFRFRLIRMEDNGDVTVEEEVVCVKVGVGFVVREDVDDPDQVTLTWNVSPV